MEQVGRRNIRETGKVSSLAGGLFYSRLPAHYQEATREYLSCNLPFKANNSINIQI
jgi:hypothetical protein